MYELIYSSVMSTKNLLEEISTNCLHELTRYKYAKHLKISERSRKGKITALEYTLELIYHFYQKDKLLKQEFQEMINSQLIDTQSLKDGDYKDAITEILKWTQSQLDTPN